MHWAVLWRHAIWRDWSNERTTQHSVLQPSKGISISDWRPYFRDWKSLYVERILSPKTCIDSCFTHEKEQVKCWFDRSRNSTYKMDLYRSASCCLFFHNFRRQAISIIQHNECKMQCNLFTSSLCVPSSKFASAFSFFYPDFVLCSRRFPFLSILLLMFFFLLSLLLILLLTSFPSLLPQSCMLTSSLICLYLWLSSYLARWAYIGHETKKSDGTSMATA